MQDLHVLYLLTTYPGITTTFVDREVIALREMGIPLHILATRKPESILSPEQVELQKIVTYLQPVSWSTGVLANLFSILTRPGRYFSTLVYVLTRHYRTARSLMKTLRLFHMGICATYLLRRRRVDHIHVHILNLGMMALVMSRMLKVPYSATAHTSGDIFVRPVLLPVKLGNAKFIATCNKYNLDHLKQIGKGIYDDKVKCIYHGLDTNQYRRKLPIIQRDRPVIVSVGQLQERKGFQILVEACGILHRQGIDFECRIIGEGPLHHTLEQQIQDLGLSEKVYLLGALSHADVYTQYEQANLFALSAVIAADGDRDGIPNVILEAMAMNLPVVSTRHSAIPEVVEDGVNGFLVPPQDADSLADALRCLLQDPAMRDLFGRNGRTKVTEMFDQVKNARLLVEEFNKIPTSDRNP